MGFKNLVQICGAQRRAARRKFEKNKFDPRILFLLKLNLNNRNQGATLYNFTEGRPPVKLLVFVNAGILTFGYDVVKLRQN